MLPLLVVCVVGGAVVADRGPGVRATPLPDGWLAQNQALVARELATHRFGFVCC